MASGATDEFWKASAVHWSRKLCGCEREEEEGGRQEQEMEGGQKHPWAVLVLDRPGIVVTCIQGMEQNWF